MSLPVRDLRFGFGFYLLISGLIHVVAFMFISFAPIQPSKAEPREVVPARVQFREPVQSMRVGASTSDFMSMGEFTSAEDGNPQLRQATGLPSHMRRAPRPHAYAKQNITRYVQLPDPGELSVEFQAPSTELPDNIEQITVDIESMETIGRIPTVSRSDTATDRMLDLGDDVADTRVRRSLQRRPSFPYTSARTHFLQRDTTIGCRVTIAAGGTVSDVSITRSSGSPELDRIIRQWITKWRYESGTETVSQSVTVRIPGE
jgi:TonB family protein